MASGESDGAPSAGRTKAVRGTAYTLVGQAVGAVIRLVNNVALTRLLAPEDFGVMALVSVFMQGLYMFSDLGIGPAIVSQPSGDRPRFLHTAFTLQLVRGLALVSGAAVIALPLATFYGVPQLRWLVPVAGLVALIEAFTSTKVWTENRHLALGRLTVVDLVSYFVSTSSSIACAYVTRSVIALPFGAIVGSVVRVSLSHLALPGVGPGLAWDEESRHELITYGRWIFVSTALTFVAGQIDRLALGRLVAPGALGVYSIALGLASIPRDLLGLLSTRVVFPMFAELLRSKADPAEMREVRRIVVSLLLVPVGILVGASHAIVELLYDTRYQLAAELMAMLGVGTWIGVLSSTYGVVVLAAGEPRWMSYGTAAKLLVFVLLVVPVKNAGGIVGIALLAGLTEGAAMLSVLLGARRRGVVTVGMDLFATLGVLAVAALTHAAHLWLTPRAGTPFVVLAIGGLVAIGVPAWGAHRLGLLKALRTR